MKDKNKHSVTATNWMIVDVPMKQSKKHYTAHACAVSVVIIVMHA